MLLAPSSAGDGATDSAYASAMTHDELDQILDRMFAEASTPEGWPGAVTVQTDDWLGPLSTVRATCASLHDGLRYREVRILVSSAFETRVMARTEAVERGEPYREPRPARADERRAAA